VNTSPLYINSIRESVTAGGDIRWSQGCFPNGEGHVFLAHESIVKSMFAVYQFWKGFGPILATSSQVLYAVCISKLAEDFPLHPSTYAVAL